MFNAWAPYPEHLQQYTNHFKILESIFWIQVGTYNKSIVKYTLKKKKPTCFGKLPSQIYLKTERRGKKKVETQTTSGICHWIDSIIVQ